MNEWEGFKGTKWHKNIDVIDFIENNYTEYTLGDDFLTDISKNHLLHVKCLT